MHQLVYRFLCWFPIWLTWPGRDRKPSDSKRGVWLSGEGIEHVRVTLASPGPFTTRFVPLDELNQDPVPWSPSSAWFQRGIASDLEKQNLERKAKWATERQDAKTESDRKRKLIDDCRKMVAEWDGGHGHHNQRAAMEKNPSFLALRRYLPQYFLDYLNKNMLAAIDPKRPDRPMAMASLASHLDRLEEEWGSAAPATAIFPRANDDPGGSLNDGQASKSSIP